MIWSRFRIPGPRAERAQRKEDEDARDGEERDDAAVARSDAAFG